MLTPQLFPVRKDFKMSRKQTVATLQCFFLAMTLFPDAQKRAQDEIDRVVGKERFPSFRDREQLPYINALVKEVLRWDAVGPTGTVIFEIASYVMLLT